MIRPEDVTPVYSFKINQFAGIKVLDEKTVGEIIESILGIVERNYQVKPTHPDPVEPEGILFYHWRNKANELQGKPND
jgi:hypothetical protein